MGGDADDDGVSSGIHQSVLLCIQQGTFAGSEPMPFFPYVLMKVSSEHEKTEARFTSYSLRSDADNLTWCNVQ